MDESIDPSVREHGRLDRDPVDVEAERVMKVRLLTERTVEVIRQPIDLFAVCGDRQDVDIAARTADGFLVENPVP